MVNPNTATSSNEPAFEAKSDSDQGFNTLKYAFEHSKPLEPHASDRSELMTRMMSSVRAVRPMTWGLIGASIIGAYALIRRSRRSV